MLTPVQMQALKKENLSKDLEKSRERIMEDFKATSSTLKSEIVGLAGLTHNAFYRVYQRGTASPRVVLSMAQVLEVSPYYYTGETDERGSFTKEVLISFLNDKGYSALADEVKAYTKPKRAYRRRQKLVEPVEMQETDTEENNLLPVPEQSQPAAQDSEEECDGKETSAAEGTATYTITVDNSRKMQDAVENLDEESAVLLLKALLKRAATGGNAEIMCDLVKRCLLS